MYHKENTNPQVRKVVIGVCEYLGGEIVMEFDNTDAAKPCDFAPPQTTRRLACGVNRLQTLEEWGFPTQPNRPSKAKNTLGRLAFYKRGCQDKHFSSRWKPRGFLSWYPAHVWK